MPPKKTDLAPMQMVNAHYLAYIALNQEEVIKDLSTHFNLNPENDAEHRNMLNFHEQLLLKCKEAGLSYEHYYITNMIVLTYFSTSLETELLQHITMSIFSILQRQHEGFEIDEHEEADEFDEFHGKGSVKEAVSAPEVYAGIAQIGKYEMDTKKPIKLPGILLTEEQAVSCCRICGFYLNKRELFAQSFLYVPSEIIGMKVVKPPCKSYCKDLAKLGEGYPYREMSKEELLIREAVIEKASNMWMEIRERTDIK